MYNHQNTLTLVHSSLSLKPFRNCRPSRSLYSVCSCLHTHTHTHNQLATASSCWDIFIPRCAARRYYQFLVHSEPLPSIRSSFRYQHGPSMSCCDPPVQPTTYTHTHDTKWWISQGKYERNSLGSENPIRRFVDAPPPPPIGWWSRRAVLPAERYSYLSRCSPLFIRHLCEGNGER